MPSTLRRIENKEELERLCQRIEEIADSYGQQVRNDASLVCIGLRVMISHMNEKREDAAR